jgi:hypothetical protein
MVQGMGCFPRRIFPDFNTRLRGGGCRLSTILSPSPLNWPAAACSARSSRHRTSPAAARALTRPLAPSPLRPRLCACRTRHDHAVGPAPRPCLRRFPILDFRPFAFTPRSSSLAHYGLQFWRQTMAENRRSKGRRSGKDRRSGVDTRTEEEKKLVRERRSGIDRRSGLDRRLNVK